MTPPNTPERTKDERVMGKGQVDTIAIADKTKQLYITLNPNGDCRIHIQGLIHGKPINSYVSRAQIVIENGEIVLKTAHELR